MSPKLTRRINLGRRYLGHSPHVPPTHTHTHTHTARKGPKPPKHPISIARHEPGPSKDTSRRRQPRHQAPRNIGKEAPEMEQFFASLKTISPLSPKHTPDADAALDGKLIDFKIFQSSIGLFIFRLKLVSQKSHFFNKVLELGS